MNRTVSRYLPWVVPMLVALSAALLLTGCQKRVAPPVSGDMFDNCRPPAGVSLTQAIKRSQKDLRHNRCQSHFDAYYVNLVNIATRAPSSENKRHISEFLLWANAENILPLGRAKVYYSRYFSTTFASLPDDYNICSNCKKKEQILAALERELRDKDKGLLKACADKKSYYTARNQYDEITLILEATCAACERSSAGELF